ncbi:AsnC family transcriptional regulator [Haloferula helveola]|uniref:AsnC family transcriptional regulator n=1 Tax=Haloferula helveola TaxID=490095 RepID=A0ABM7RDY8_9BACT|nr:AsnC family transcriptional regulator [Haloferula helveola]
MSKPWTLLSRHGQALVSVAGNPEIRVTQLAAELNVTERSARMILTSLRQSHALEVTRLGRNNTYAVDLDFRLTHPLESRLSLRRFLEFYGSSVTPLDRAG